MSETFQLVADKPVAPASQLVQPFERDTMGRYCRERFGLHPCWQVAKWCRGMGEDDELPDGMVRVTGAAYFAKTTGKNKGRINYDKPLEGTKKTVFFTIAEFEAWENARDAAGICKKCEGTGQEWVSSGRDGTKYRTCKRCRGTGDPRNAAMRELEQETCNG